MRVGCPLLALTAAKVGFIALIGVCAPALAADDNYVAAEARHDEPTMRALVNLALVFATTDIRLAVPGKPERIMSMRYTAAYINRKGQWRMLSLQIQDRATD